MKKQIIPLGDPSLDPLVDEMMGGWVEKIPETGGKIRPTLTTKRLTLTPFRAGLVDFQHVSWLNDPEVVKFSEQRHRTHTIQSQHLYLNEFPLNSCIWLIRTDRDIGTVTAYLDTMNQTANFGILIGEKDCWGQGYGKEALSAVMTWAHSAGIKKFEIGCREDNSAMAALARAVGMYTEGAIPDHFKADDGKRMYKLLFGICW